MSSPCNREQYRSEHPSHPPLVGAPSFAAARSEPGDDWALLRATPDYDEEEMRGVGLPLYLAPGLGAPSAPPRLTQPGWLPLPDTPAHPGAAPVRGLARPSGVAPAGAASAPWSVPEPAAAPKAPSVPPARWPEAETVAMMATDLYDAVLEEEVSLDVGPLGWLTIRPAGHDAVDGWEDDPASASEVWAFLPDEMLGGDRGHDLLGTALQAGERAGLLDTSAERADPSGRTEGGRPDPTDLLDEALAAGERSGLMDGLA
jgi:hypothetical protein